MDEVRNKHLAWLEAVLADAGKSRTEFARLAGIDPSTLTKFVNDPTGAARLNTLSIERIAAMSRVPPFERRAPDRVRGLAEDEAQPWLGQPAARGETAAVNAWKGGRNGVDPWVLRSRALESAGYMPGDILIVDLNETPAKSDIVCAQVYNRAGQAETVFRLYEHPFLTAATLDRALMKPLIADGQNVVIRGVVVGSIRPRAPMAA